MRYSILCVEAMRANGHSSTQSTFSANWSKPTSFIEGFLIINVHPVASKNK